jgi:hypothetical protein
MDEGLRHQQAGSELAGQTAGHFRRSSDDSRWRTSADTSRHRHATDTNATGSRYAAGHCDPADADTAAQVALLFED